MRAVTPSRRPLALLLIDLRGRSIVAGLTTEDAMSFDLPLTQVQLSEHLGITPVHVNRILRSFREKNVASFRNGSVTLLDLAEGGLKDIFAAQKALLG